MSSDQHVEDQSPAEEAAYLPMRNAARDSCSQQQVPGV